MTQQMVEKRAHPRVAEAVKVRFRFAKGPGNAETYGYVEGVTRDISEGGLFIELGSKNKFRDDPTGNFILFKSTLALEINLAGAGMLNAFGKAVWIEKRNPEKEKEYCRGVAIQFTEMSVENTSRIRDFIQTRLQD